jgi:AcrR family transcriptional regulator
MTAETKTRVPLTRERIIQAALELADANGIESLSMRKLGQKLGFEAMSLYNHVANKDDLLEGMLDFVLAETEPPTTPGEWDDAIRKSAISVHDALRRHPWSCTLLMEARRIRPARLRYMDLLLGRLRDAGFSADTTYHAYHVLDGHIFGFALWEIGHTYTPEEASSLVERFAHTITPQAYPYLHEHAKQHMDDSAQREVSAFEFGLDLIIDGLKKIHAGSLTGG